MTIICAMPPPLADEDQPIPEKITDLRNPLPSRAQPRMPQLKALTSIRAFAALYVGLYHMVRPFSLWGPLATFVSAGYTGVSFFFLLSGFILTYTHGLEYEADKGNAKRFWVARFARIYPVYLLVALLSAYTSRSQFHPRFHILAYVADLFMLQSWSIRMVSFFNVVAWSLSVEAFFYFVFPFVAGRMRPQTLRSGVLTLCGCYALVLAVACTGLLVDPEGAWFETTRVSGGHSFVFAMRRYPILQLPEFLCGVALGWVYLQRPLNRTFARSAAWLGLVGLCVALALSVHLPFLLLHNGLLIPFYALLVLGLTQEHLLTRWMSAAPLLLLGEASYSFYLIHFNFNNYVSGSFGWKTNLAGLIPRMLILIPLCIALHIWVERPARRFVLQWYGSRKARPAMVPA